MFNASWDVLEILISDKDTKNFRRQNRNFENLTYNFISEEANLLVSLAREQMSNEVSGRSLRGHLFRYPLWEITGGGSPGKYLEKCSEIPNDKIQIIGVGIVYLWHYMAIKWIKLNWILFKSIGMKDQYSSVRQFSNLWLFLIIQLSLKLKTVFLVPFPDCCLYRL